MQWLLSNERCMIKSWVDPDANITLPRVPAVVSEQEVTLKSSLQS
jgi:hypothetical protein